MKLRQLFEHPIIQNPLFRFLVFVLTAAFSGIIGNRADAILLNLVDVTQQYSGLPDWVTVITVVIIAFPVAVLSAVITALPLTIVVLQLRRLIHRSDILSAL